MALDSNPLQILYVVHAYKPAYRVGGPVFSVSAAAEKLALRGHQVVVFTTNSNLDEELDVPLGQPVRLNGVEVWYFKRHEPLKKFLPFVPYLSKSLGYLYAPDLSKILSEQIDRFDLVHTHMPYVYPTLIAGKAAIRGAKPLFYHQRGVFDPERLKFRGMKKRFYIAAFERPIMRKATTLIALTQSEVKSYRALGVTTPCRVIPNGIDTNLYYRLPTDEFTRSIPIKPNQFLILFMGRLHPVKGADILLESFLRIGPQFSNAVLVLAGPDEYNLESTFRKRVHDAGLADRVLFPGMVSGDFKLNLLARADLFCLPSIAEGFSMAVLEALASATPVVISPGCHFDEIEAQGAGWIVDRSVDKLVDTLTNILREPRYRLIEMREAAFHLVQTYYTWEKVITQLEETYKEGIARHKAYKGGLQY